MTRMSRRRAIAALLTVGPCAGLVRPVRAQTPASAGSPAASPVSAGATVNYRGLDRAGFVNAPVGAAAPSTRLRIPALPNPDPNGQPDAPSSPIVADGLLFVADRARLHAYDLATGQERWSQSLAPITFSSPVVSGGIVVYGTGADGLIAFDEFTGAERWRLAPGGTPAVSGIPVNYFDQPATIVDGVVYATQSTQGWLYALDLKTGAMRWQADTHGGVSTGLAYANGLLYLATDAAAQRDPATGKPSGVIAFNPATGAERWRTPLGAGDQAYSGPAVVGGVVYLGVSNFSTGVGYVLALDAATGAQRWNSAVDAPMGAGALAVGGGLAVVPCGEAGTVIALDAATGKERWVHSGTAPVFGSLVIAADAVVYFDNARVLHALELASGDARWNFDTGGTTGGVALGGPWVDDGVIVTRAEGAILVLTTASGTPSKLATPTS